MKKLLLVLAVLLLPFAFGLVKQRSIPSVSASSEISDIYQGDLILDGNDITIIKGRFDINGSIIVEDNATLVLQDAILNFTQTEDSQYNITLRNPLNGNPYLNCYNSIIETNFRIDIRLEDNSTATINNSTIKAYLMTYDSSTLTITNSSQVDVQFSYTSSSIIIHNSTVREWHIYHHPNAQILESEINSLLIGMKSVNCTINELYKGSTAQWNLIANCSVNILPGGLTPNITVINSQIDGWRFAFYGASEATIVNSLIGATSTFDTSKAYITNTKIASYIQASGSSIISLINSTYSWASLYEQGSIHVNWHLDIHVVDSISQDVPAAHVAAIYPNSTLAKSDLTDVDGTTRLTLIEKVINATGEHIVGNYTIEATYETHSAQTTVNMTEHKQTTLTLADFIIPEFPSTIIIFLIIITTTLTATASRKKATDRPAILSPK